MSWGNLLRSLFVLGVRGIPASSVLWCCTAKGEDASSSAQPECVVLLHGLGRTAVSMKRLEWALSKDGYRVINLGYPSTRLSIESAAGWLDKALEQRIPENTAKVHFVTHSLGGIVLRQYRKDFERTNFGRVVMFAPPNRGSELADRFKGNFLYRLFTGPAGQELGTDASSPVQRLGPVDFELGVIAGDRSINPVLSAWIPGPNDGKVSVASAQIEGMQDVLVVHHSHTWMMWRKDVVKATLTFLKAGRFDRCE